MYKRKGYSPGYKISIDHFDNFLTIHENEDAEKMYVFFSIYDKVEVYYS